jgi:SAM-dependent methyltransferase
MATYTGIERPGASIPSSDQSACDRLIWADLSAGLPEELKDCAFDVIIFSHVIEHLHNGLEVVKALCALLKPHGRIYIEMPSIRSLYLPSGIGTLNFFDDPTHIRIYPLADLANLVSLQGVKIIHCGVARSWYRLLLYLPLFIPVQLYALGRYGCLTAKAGMWDLLGFADYLYGEMGDQRR